MRRRPRRPHVDWVLVMDELAGGGVPAKVAAAWLGLGQRTLEGWRKGVEPRHMHGEAIIALWCEVTAKDRRELPMVIPTDAR